MVAVKSSLKVVIKKGGFFMSEKMKIDEKLVYIMACPKCKGQIEVSSDGGFVLCNVCSLKYRIEEGIPVMLIDEAVAI